MKSPVTNAFRCWTRMPDVFKWWVLHGDVFDHGEYLDYCLNAEHPGYKRPESPALPRRHSRAEVTY